MEETGGPDWITVPQFLRRYKGKLGRSFVYEAIRSGRIPALRMGRKLLVRSDVLDRVLEQGHAER